MSFRWATRILPAADHISPSKAHELPPSRAPTPEETPSAAAWFTWFSAAEINSRPDRTASLQAFILSPIPWTTYGPHRPNWLRRGALLTRKSEAKRANEDHKYLRSNFTVDEKSSRFAKRIRDLEYTLWSDPLRTTIRRVIKHLVTYYKKTLHTKHVHEFY